MERMEGLGDVEEGSGAVRKPQIHDGLHERVYPLGRRLLERLGMPVIDDATGLSSVVLPAGDFGLLVLGVPVPVFSYMGDDNQALQRRVVELLSSVAGETLHDGRHVALHSFSQIFDRASEEEILELLPGFRSLNGTRKASFLGVQMVSVLPLNTAETSLWPHGPTSLRLCAERFREAIPRIYEQLDQDLVRIHRSRPLSGMRRPLWAAEPPG